MRLISMILSLTVAAALPGCTQFPALDETISPEAEAADYPALVPLEPLLVQVGEGAVDAPATTSALEGRVARLRDRAARLRNSGISGTERERLQDSVD